MCALHRQMGHGDLAPAQALDGAVKLANGELSRQHYSHANYRPRWSFALFLIQASVRVKDLGAIAGLLVPARDTDRIRASYRLITGLMSNDVKHKRDFLWRESEPGTLIILAGQEPKGFLPIFNISIMRFMPCITDGDQISLRMRVSPTIYKAVEGARRPKRHDLVMDALYNISGERSQIRHEVVQKIITEWLTAQGAIHGFKPELTKTAVYAYRQLQLLETDGRKISFSAVDIESLVEIFDAERFLVCLNSGLGGARSFGCGLILISDNRGQLFQTANLVP